MVISSRISQMAASGPIRFPRMCHNGTMNHESVTGFWAATVKDVQAVFSNAFTAPTILWSSNEEFIGKTVIA